MKKLSTKAEQKKREKRNNLIIGIVMIFVLTLSVLGIVVNSFNSKGEGEQGGIDSYKGITFVDQGVYWNASIGGYSFLFATNPANLSNSNFKETGNFSDIRSYFGKPLYISSDVPYLESMIKYNFGKFAQRIQSACYKEEGCPENVPIKTCADNLIIVEESNSSEISQIDNCVFIRGASEDLPFLVDKYTLKVLGVDN